MKRAAVIINSITVALVLCASAILAPIAHATPLAPDWMQEGAIVNKSTVAYPKEKCVSEVRQIVPNNLYYYKNEDYAPKTWCIYHYNGFDITFFEREASSVLYDTIDVFNLHKLSDAGMAVAFDDGPLTPVSNDSFNYYLKHQLVYTKNTSNIFLRTGCEYNGCVLSVFDLRSGIVPKQGTNIYEYNWKKLWDLSYLNGEKILIDGVNNSANGDWISFAARSVGLGRLNTRSLDWDFIEGGSNYFVPSYMYYYPHTAISNDGKTAFIAGAYIPSTVVEYTTGCSVVLPSILDEKGGIRYSLPTTCKKRILSELESARQIRPDLPFLIVDLQLDQNDAVLNAATQTGQYYRLYPSNTQTFSAMQYLALGDSYSSGEGDIDASGITHYIPGTNVLGNYKDGIPRELCHVSDRSYPFLLANDMQISRGSGMQSITCSGAIRDDVYTNAGPSFTYAQYAGQNTPLYGAALPRLQNIIAKESLKQEALNAFIPGRIQQIELVKKYQPKVATIGISGNDLGFGNILMACIQKFADTCDYAKPAGLADLGSVIQANYDQQLALYRALKQASPGTDFYAVGYPQFINGDKAYCWSILDSLNEQERLMISNAVTFANQTIKNAASAAGIKYINIEDVLKDYSGDICSGSGLVTDPLHKVLAGNVTEGLLGRFEDSATPTSTSPLTDYINKASKTVFREYTENPYYYPMQALAMYFQETFHPNALGHKAMYNFIHAHQNGTSLLDDECDGVAIICPSQQMAIVPNVPDYFGKVTAGTMFRDIVHVESGAPNGFTLQSGLASAPRGSVVRVALSESVYAQGAELEIRIETDGRLIGKTLAGPLGGFMQQIVLPADLTVGYYFVSVQGNNTKYQQLILITGQKGDMDADGISDTTDTCEFINPIGKDDDNDGIDDACDITIALVPTGGTISGKAVARSSAVLPSGAVPEAQPEQVFFLAAKEGGVQADLRRRLAHYNSLAVLGVKSGKSLEGRVVSLGFVAGVSLIMLVVISLSGKHRQY